ncbi:MAG: NfeD family protein [Candidatus Njordarchaeales archaeon]
MADFARFAAAIAFLIIISFATNIIIYDPLLGLTLILMGILILSLAVDPASAKALMKVFAPVIFALLILPVVFSITGTLNREIAIVAVIFLILLFITSGALMGGVEAKSSLVLTPLVAIPTLLALLYDPTGTLAILISTSLIFGFLFVTWYLVRRIPPVREMTLPSRVGVAIEDLTPRGRVKLDGEIWWAMARGWKIEKNTRVYVIGKRDLELIVVPLIECPNCGMEYPITNVPERCSNCGFDLSAIVLQALKKYMVNK